MSIDNFWAVVPAGGAGTRLWPLSRAGSPKFLHDLTGTGRTLLQGTVDRLAPLVGDRVIVVTGDKHADAVRRQLPELPDDRVLAEPSPRDSMPAIGLAAAILEQRDPAAILGSFHADHVIAGIEEFQSCVHEAVAVAADGYFTTIGIAPSFPSTGFGYIAQGDPLKVVAAPRAHAVREFVEKPDAETAERYLADGYLWNSGMFAVRAGVLMDLLADYQPGLAAGLRAIAADPSTLAQAWPGLTKIAIDHAVAEPAAAAGRVAVIPGDFTWDDVGDFASLASLLAEVEDAPGVRVLGDSGLVLMQEATGVIAPRSGRTIVALGVDDIVVIDTDDAVLVTTKERAQDVKNVVEALKLSDREHLT